MEHFLHILRQPDNLPIAGMAVALLFLLGVWWRQARRFDAPAAAPAPPTENETDAEAALPERVNTWPYLVRVELLATLVAMVVLTAWSILVDAPLEGPADPNRTPDPSKAPWYFLGLQELLVYFDPWIAGVMVPLLIIVGLMLVPYLDRNPRGSGQYTFRQRRFAVATFLFGFVGLWVVPILIGVFCRGPGWNWYWPWESWEVAKPVAHPSRDLADLLGVSGGSGAFVVGGLAVGVWYGLGFVFYLRRRHTAALRALGGGRYALTAFLFLTMMAIPVKMLLRLALDVKYIWATPWFNL